jgi:hypothetical protein
MTPEEKVAKTRSDLTDIAEIEKMLQARYEEAKKIAATSRDRDFKEWKDHRQLLLDTYKEFAHNVLCAQGRGMHHYYRRHYQETITKVHMPDRYSISPVGIEMEFDWEDRGYTETSKRVVEWEDIFAYEAGKRVF